MTGLDNSTHPATVLDNASEDSLAELANLESVGLDVENGVQPIKNVESLYYTGKSKVDKALEGGLMGMISRDMEVTLTFKNINSWVPNMLFGQAKKDAGESAPSKRQVAISAPFFLFFFAPANYCSYKL